MARTALFSRSTPGGVFDYASITQNPNDTWFVFSGAGAQGADAVGYGRNPDAPFLTLDYAIGQCTASKGDVIYVLPGHAESFAATNGFDADVIGIKIIGLGWGNNRPTFTFTDTDAQVNIGADSVWIENCRFVAGISAVVAGMQVEAMDDFTLKDCEFNYGTNLFDFALSVELETPCHRAHITGCRFLAEPAVAGAVAAIQFTGGASSNCVVENCEFFGDYSTACVNIPTALCQGFMFVNNLVYNADAGEPYLEAFSGTTGVITGTRGFAGAATIAANAVADAMAHCENYVCNTAGTTAIYHGAGGAPALDAD